MVHQMGGGAGEAKFEGAWDRGGDNTNKGPFAEPPPQFPAPLASIESSQRSWSTSGDSEAVKKAELEERTKLIIKHRDLQLRFQNMPTYLKLHGKKLGVKKYSDKYSTVSQEIGCSTLPECLQKPLPAVYFPEELKDMLIPAKGLDGKPMTSSSINISQKFKRKTVLDFRRLEEKEKMQKTSDEKNQKEDDANIRKMSMASEISEDLDGDYGINHYESDLDALQDGEGPEATFD
uniref:Uncharacterized protein n=1 Tax=Aplanochytrium stocchinoi TaxID=215587 RepID=A0A6S8C5V3_9STRA|mmetsp:Transcript_17610/g.21365  ORF Transcript_17610/g.21365 Transcript_17610/m.21365 type:complete len:234 (+) Transcript_17610:166-867(+)|eukprot:CAMPEP_0204827140 /NCGR_PEP_ID=MMETSP1346-20131115/4687_1 /ASSEMBLY_ACC=CAM_ASM_000771 /TAXON_ID=215587 /ORGANISM="Aplanochytrium stocchinoi, Strain GSBS06" /LENGTH=233 /DNA_ID=CAMNT_0051955471 /DNA_START=104 /DNA_END=805 /DNA_ORIENTATION=-